MSRIFTAIAVLLAITMSLSASLECGFVVDLSPPFIVPESAFPPAETTMTDTEFTITFALDDLGAGVWIDSVLTLVIVNGADTSEYPATFAIGTEFSPSDTVEVCIRAMDMIFDTLDCTCPANVLDTCWTFYIEDACSTWFDSLWFWQEDFCDGVNVVEICYRLESTCDGPWDVEIFASSDGGASWEVPLMTFFGEAGHIGTVADTGLHCFQWLLSTDLPDFETCEFALMLDGDSILSPILAEGCTDSRSPHVSIECPMSAVRAGEGFVFNWYIDDMFFGDYPCTLHFFAGSCDIEETHAISDGYIYWPAPMVNCPSCTLVVVVRDSFCNWSYDTCAFEIYIPCYAGPFAEVVYPDSCGYITSCADQAVAWVVSDTTGFALDTTSFAVRVEVSGRSEPVDTVLSIVSPALTWVGDSLLGFDPSSIGMEFRSWDTVTVTLISANNEVGCALETPVSCRFIVDLDPPVVLGGFSPPPGTVFDEIPVIFTPEISIHDSITERAEFAQLVEHWRGGSIIWSDSTLWGTLIDIEVENGDTIRICAIEISDFPDYDYCPPNTAPDTCWWVYVSLLDTIPPRSWIIEPVDVNGDGSVISACECQPIVFGIASEHAITPESTLLRIGADIHAFDPSWMIFSDDFDSLTIDPTVVSCWEGLTYADFALLDLVDTIGAHITDSVRGGFIIDREPPNINMLTPDTLTAEVSTIAFEAFDEICGEAPIDSIAVTRNGLPDTTAHSVESVILRDLADGDSLFVCVFAHDDCADYCGPNFAMECWDIFVSIEAPDTLDTIPPTAELVYPFDGAISACSLQTVIWTLSDDYSGIDTSRIWVSADGAVFAISDAELELMPGDTLVFTPSAHWPEGVHSACLDSLYDLAGNPLPDAVCIDFTIDYTPPEVHFIWPACSTEVHETSFDIVVAISDDISPIFFGESWIIFGADSIQFVDAEMTITPELLDTIWRDGDTVSFCVSARDSTDFCTGDNEAFVCCEFYIVLGELSAEAIFPENNTITSCSLQSAQWVFDGELDTSSIHVVLNGEDDFLWPCEELGFSGDTLTFTPSTVWANGDSVELCIVRAENIHGVALGETVCVSWILDFEPPTFADLSPVPESMVATISPIISVLIFDEIAGVDADSVNMQIDGAMVSATMSGDTLRFDTSEGGLSWLGGDTVSVCVWAVDLARYCGANRDSICWEFFIAQGGPEIFAIHPPEDSLWSACEGQGAVFHIFDPDGIDTTTIELIVDGSVSDAWIYRNDSLIYTPVAGPSDGDTVTVCATASDMLGNPADSPACITFFMDLSPPEIISINPPPGARVEADFVLTVELVDEGSGIDESSIRVIANGASFAVGDGALSWDGAILRIDFPTPFTYGDTVLICIESLTDSPDLCAPNVLDSCWEYRVAVLPDLWTSSAHVSLVPTAVAYGDSFVFKAMGFYEGEEILPRTMVEITSGAGVLRRVEYTNLSPGDTIYEILTIFAEGASFYGEVLPICLVLDADDEVFESDEDNNIACANLTILSSECGATPNPFSPNADGINDEANFTYPNQGVQPATIEIYDVSGRLVTQLEDITFWDGNDSAGTSQPKGVYIYIIMRDGEVLCKGTIHIAK
ncbi:MAG TPA: hypothetical protein ENN07_06315 [candidate division Zixibacteria bacterium]|nr:hypothetical protein [candidate division Zixibacteria bacterium]